jgi:hypothetical protein
MTEFTIEQKRAIALANARARMAQEPEAAPAAPRAPYNPATDLQNIYARRTREGAGRVAEGLRQGGWGGFGNALMGGVDYLGSPISAAQEFVVGRPVETATGGALPANVVGDVVGMAAPFAPLAISKVAQGGRALSNALKYGTGAPGAAKAVGAEAKALMSQEQATAAAAAAKAEADAIAQAERAKNLLTRQTDTKRRALAALLEDRKATTASAKRAETKGVTQGKRSETLLGEQAIAEKAATPSPFTEGRVTTLDERGQPIQTDIVKAKEDIIKARSDERTLLEAPIIERVKAKEAAGESIADTSESQNLLKEVRGKLNPSAITSPSITSKPTSEQARVYSYVDEVLSRRREPITADQAAAGKEAGQDIIKVNVTDPVTNEVAPRFYRVFKTQYEAVDNLRRRFGDAYHGKDATGFEGVSESLIKNMYGKIRNIQKDYVGADLYEPLQTSYTKYTKQLAPFNETQIGKSISGTQGTTDIANLTPSQVPNAVLSKGAGGFEQVQALGGNPTNALLDEVATAFNNPKTNAPRTSEEVRTLLYNSDLGSAVAANPTVKAAVAKHLTQLEDAEMAAVKAEGFGKRAEALKVKSEGSAKASGAAKAKVQSYDVELANLQSLPPEKMAARAETIFKDMAKNGVINPEQYAQLLSDVRRNKKIGTNAEKLIAKAGENAKAAEKAAAKATNYKAQITSLESLPYNKIASEAESIFNKMAKDGVITSEQQAKLLSDVRNAEKELNKEASKKRILLAVASAAGILTASKVGADVFNVIKD